MDFSKCPDCGYNLVTRKPDGGDEDYFECFTCGYGGSLSSDEDFLKAMEFQRKRYELRISGTCPHRFGTGPPGPTGKMGSQFGYPGSRETLCLDCGEKGLGEPGPRGPRGLTCKTCGYWDEKLINEKKFEGKCPDCSFERSCVETPASV